MKRMKKGKNVLLAAALLFALGGASACTSSQTSEGTAQSTATTTQSQPSEEQSAQSPGKEQSGLAGDSASEGEESWTMGPDSHDWVGEVTDPPLITGMRAATHGDYDRLVVDFTGTDPLGWEVQWVKQVHEQGRGEPLDIEGPAYLDISIRGTAIPATEEDYEAYFGDELAPSTDSIRSIYDSSFEGTTHVVIGSDTERPFRVFQLEDPLRLVVDVKN